MKALQEFLVSGQLPDGSPRVATAETLIKVGLSMLATPGDSTSLSSGHLSQEDSSGHLSQEDTKADMCIDHIPPYISERKLELLTAEYSPSSGYAKVRWCQHREIYERVFLE